MLDGQLLIESAPVGSGSEQMGANSDWKGLCGMFEQPNQEFVEKRVLDPKFKKYAVAMIQSETFSNAVKQAKIALENAGIEFMQKTRFGMEVEDFFFGKPGPTPLPGVFLEPARGAKGIWMVWMYFTISESDHESLKAKLDNAFFPAGK